MTRTRVDGIQVEHERIAGVLTERGTVATSTVIDEPGPSGHALMT